MRERSLLRHPRLTAVAGLLLAFSAAASEPVSDCTKEPNQLGMNACVQRELRRAETELQAARLQLTRGIEREQQAMLLTAQVAWERFRDADCAFESSSVAGGSVAPMVHTQCLARLTRERTQALRRHLNCEEGDLSCVRPARP